MRTIRPAASTRLLLQRCMLGAAPWVLALVLPITPGFAQSVADEASRVAACSPDETIRFRGGTARLENDLFVNTDQNYTNGVAFTAVTHDITGDVKTACLPAPVRMHAKLIRRLDPGFWNDGGSLVATQNVVAKFGQSMFTPRDPASADLIRDDRPYAGLLYVGLSWNRRTHDLRQNSERLDTREITLGVIGPLALGRQAQNLVHDTIGADRFLGWNNQLKNEPALQLAMARKYRDYRSDGAIQPQRNASPPGRAGSGWCQRAGIDCGTWCQAGRHACISHAGVQGTTVEPRLWLGRIKHRVLG